jgi:PTH1 family peptidyl-tRNA hydrolase
MRLVVGLGNPGQRYADTRHNVGFRLVEQFASRHSISLDELAYDGRLGRGALPNGAPVAVFQPLTYMNRSGGPVAQALTGLGIADPATDLLVVYDDVDLPFGRMRLRPRGGAGGHNGVADIIEVLESQNFVRLRFGVGRPNGMLATADWVLAAFSPEERAELPARLASGAEAIEWVLLLGLEKAMNRFNSMQPDTDES